jgi:hypothetical protein
MTQGQLTRTRILTGSPVNITGTTASPQTGEASIYGLESDKSIAGAFLIICRLVSDRELGVSNSLSVDVPKAKDPATSGCDTTGSVEDLKPIKMQMRLNAVEDCTKAATPATPTKSAVPSTPTKAPATPTKPIEPTKTPTPLVLKNIKLFVNGQSLTEAQTRADTPKVKVGSDVKVSATWEGGALDGSGWFVQIKGDGGNYLVVECKKGNVCEGTDTIKTQYNGHGYSAELHAPDGKWQPSNYMFIDIIN